MPGEKGSNAEVEIYVNQICIMMIKGIIRRDQILQYVRKMNSLRPKDREKRNWVKIQKCDRTIDIYIKRAKELFIEMSKEDRQTVKSLYVAQLEDMYQEARKNGHLQTANNIMKNKMYLQGFGGFNVKGTFNVKNFDIDLSDEEEAAYKERLKNMYGEE